LIPRKQGVPLWHGLTCSILCSILVGSLADVERDMAGIYEKFKPREK